MTDQLWLILIVIGSYLIGGIPFGYLAGKWNGVDLFQAGSRNIGATNTGRILGRKWGVIVFLADLLKGALPVYFASLTPRSIESTLPETLAAVFAFLGHIFPIYLRFSGGKGVATGAGTVIVLTGLPGILALYTWLVVAATFRFVSLGSIAAVTTLVSSWLYLASDPWSSFLLPKTLFVIAGSSMVVIRHYANIQRLLAQTETRLSRKTVWPALQRTLHLTGLGIALGAGIFFNFLAAPRIFEEFKSVVAHSPSDRTAMLDIKANLTEEQFGQLSSALAGSAVGPLFGPFFLLQLICVMTALITAFPWRITIGSIHRWRVRFLMLALILAVISIPLSHYVTQLRIERFSPDLSIADPAKSRFGPVHGISLLIAWITTGILGLAMACSGKIPVEEDQTPTEG
jgi:acyl phosphate:glycerol-3-phosphate acyltransferase